MWKIITNININELLYKIIHILFCKRGYYVETTYDHTLARRGAIMLVSRWYHEQSCVGPTWIANAGSTKRMWTVHIGPTVAQNINAILGNTTITYCRLTYSTVRKSHRTLTGRQVSKSTSSLFLDKMVAKLDTKKCITKQRPTQKHRNPHKQNNKLTTTERTSAKATGGGAYMHFTGTKSSP